VGRRGNEEGQSEEKREKNGKKDGQGITSGEKTSRNESIKGEGIEKRMPKERTRTLN